MRPSPMHLPMRTCTFLLAMLLALTAGAHAQRVTIPLIFKNIQPVAEKEFTFYVGIHPDATMSVDTALDEREIPPFPPPGGVFYVWSEIETDTETIWVSPLVLQPSGSGAFVRTYHIGVKWDGGILKMGLMAGLPEYVDSVYITDVIGEFPSNFYKVKLESGMYAETDNPALDEFKCIVFYNTPASGVEETPATQPLHAFPNPASTTVSVRGIRTDAQRILVVDVTGRIVMEVPAGGMESIDVSVASLASGMYSIVECRDHVKNRQTLFVRQ